MKAILIHLSDIHFRSSPLLHLSEKISNAINASYSHSTLCIILITGDIAYSGKKAEYQLAEGFISDLKKRIEKIADQIKTVTCPGNHDCDFASDSTVRDIVLENVIKTNGAEINEKIIESVSEPQNQYFLFQDKYQSKQSRIFSRNIFKAGNHEILIDSINVAWMSKLKELQGRLILPLNHLIEPDGSNLRIVLHHHPSNWLESTNARKFNEHLEKNYHFILSGHEHQDKTYSCVDLNSNDHSTYFFGGVLQQQNDNGSSFTSIEIDLHKEEFEFKTWKYNEKESLYSTNDEDCHMYSIGRKSLIQTSRGSITEEFELFLESVEIPFQHPRVQKVTLEKIYTPVLMRKNDALSDDEENVEKLKTNNLHNKIISENFINILGEPQSGKTTTLKILYKDLLGKGFFPVYLQGDSIKKKQQKEVDALIKSTIQKQYRSPTYEKIVQNESSRIAILIDNIESSPLNEDAKDDVINYLSEKFNYIAITMGISSFATSFTTNIESSLLSLFTTYNLEEFSYSARGKLIEAWVKLGQEDSLNENELDSIVNRKETLLNSLAHSNLLPTLPGHVLLILQYMETGTINPEMSGAYGHIYQSLVTQTLATSKQFAIDELNAYLANLAFTIYSKKSTSLDETEARESHNKYCEFAEIDFPRDAIINNLKSLNVIREINGSISFKHPYLYYYFVAIYIQKRVDESEAIEAIINAMIETIHRDDSCNILIFYAHLSNHQNIIKKLLERINQGFDEFQPCRFDKDTMEISKLYQEMATTLIIKEETASKRREIVNRSLDARNTRRNGEEKDPNNEKDLQYKLSSCFRSLDVLGQILRSNRTNLSGKMKNTAVKNGCDMALRITSAFNKFLSHKSEEVIDELKSHIKDKHLSEQEKTVIATRFIAALSEMIVFSILKKLSISLGCQALKPCFQNLLQNDDTNQIPPSYKLIETMIQLENSKSFPKNKIESANNDLKDYHLGKRMLQRLVHAHFLKYKIDFTIKQWAHDTLSIKYVTSKKNMDGRQLTLDKKINYTEKKHH